MSFGGVKHNGQTWQLMTEHCNNSLSCLIDIITGKIYPFPCSSHFAGKPSERKELLLYPAVVASNWLVVIPLALTRPIVVYEAHAWTQ